jgi:hypothetical protein
MPMSEAPTPQLTRLRLAQAAPRMYEALKEIQGMLEQINTNPEPAGPSRARALLAWATAEAAIRDAERDNGEATLAPPASELFVALDELIEAERDWLLCPVDPVENRRAQERKAKALREAAELLNILRGAKR